MENSNNLRSVTGGLSVSECAKKSVYKSYFLRPFIFIAFILSARAHAQDPPGKLPDMVQTKTGMIRVEKLASLDEQLTILNGKMYHQKNKWLINFLL